MSTLHRSEDREEITSSELWWCADRVVSSANISATQLLRDNGISFIYKRNKVGPRTKTLICIVIINIFVEQYSCV